MAKHPVVRGHPVHAILSDLPATLVPLAFAAEAAHRLRPDDRTGFAANATRRAALAGTLAAAAAGVWDWWFMPRDYPAWKPATLHGVLEATTLAALVRASRRPGRRLALLAAASGCMLAGAAIGGELVFRYGWRVRPAEEIEIAERALRRDGLGRYIDDARDEVTDFERRQTFLPA